MTRTANTLPGSGVGTRPSLPARLPRVGGWELVRLAAEGVISSVYQARPVGSPERPAQYALKCLRPGREREPAALAALCREAFVGRTVSHPHLVSILASHTAEPPYFVVMPWLEGATLAQRLAAGWKPPVPLALWIARQVAEALEGLARQGWMHADVKPANILVGPRKRATLIDLGFARRPEEPLAEPCLVGTPHYLAPEALTATWATDIRSDIYSLGVVLYELIGGRRPFAAHDVSQLVREHRQAAPKPLRRLNPHAPKGVAALVHRMLAKAPLRRPQTPRELIDELVRLEIETFPER